MTKKLKKKPSKKLKPERSLKLELLIESKLALIYTKIPLNKLAKTILLIKKQLEEVEQEEKKTLGEI